MSSEPVNPDRGIDSIAHLFLSRADKNTQHRRVPPAQNSKAPEPQDVVELSGDSDLRAEPALGEIVLAGHLRDFLHKARLYAHYLLERDEHIALVLIGKYQASLITINQDKSDVSQIKIIAETENIDTVLIPAIKKFGQDYDNLLLVIEPAFLPRLPQFLPNFEHLTVLSTVGSSDMVESYKAIKSVSSYIQRSQQVSLFVCNAPDSNAADDVYYKLADTARNHLGLTLIPAGCHIEKIEPKAVEFEPEEFDPTIDAVKGKIADLLANDKFMPEQFVTMDFDSKNEEDFINEPMEDESDFEPFVADIPVEVEKTQEKPQARQEPVMSVVSETINIKNAYYPVRVDKLPQNDRQLNQALFLNMPAWLRNPVGLVALPVNIAVLNSENFKLLVDSSGRLHIMTAVLAVQNDTLINALNALGWVKDNLQLIVNSCPQMRIDNTVEAGLVVAAGDNVMQLKQACGQISNPVNVYQIHLLTGGDDALLVIPV